MVATATAMITSSTARIVSASKRRPASITSAPSPTAAMNISPLIMPLTARPMPSRSPAMISGMATGITMRRKTCRSLAQNDRPISIRATGTGWIAVAVLMTMMKVAYITITPMIEARPRPKIEKKIGANTSDGAVSNAYTYRSSAWSTFR